MGTAHELERIKQCLPVGADRGQQATAIDAFDVGERQQQMLGRDVLIPKQLRFFFCRISNRRDLSAERGLCVTLFCVACRFLLGCRAQRRHIDADFLQNRNDDALRLRHQREEQVHVVHGRIASLAGQGDGVVERFCALHG